MRLQGAASVGALRRIYGRSVCSPTKQPTCCAKRHLASGSGAAAEFAAPDGRLGLRRGSSGPQLALAFPIAQLGAAPPAPPCNLRARFDVFSSRLTSFVRCRRPASATAPRPHFSPETEQTSTVGPSRLHPTNLLNPSLPSLLTGVGIGRDDPYLEWPDRPLAQAPPSPRRFVSRVTP